MQQAKWRPKDLLDAGSFTADVAGNAAFILKGIRIHCQDPFVSHPYKD